MRPTFARDSELIKKKNRKGRKGKKARGREECQKKEHFANLAIEAYNDTNKNKKSAMHAEKQQTILLQTKTGGL